jgi:cardiolipin synthase
MFAELSANGVHVRMTNPVGPLFVRYPARNHKKLIVADDVAYIGGVNFSDHNFAWSDFMLRLEGEEVASFLADDFEATFAGRPRSAQADLRDLRLYSMDGRANDRSFTEVIQTQDAAEKEIVIVSPYLTFPFTGVLARARRRGVRVGLVTPLTNNKPIARRYVLAQAQRHGFEVRLAPPMSHAKAIAVDGRHLIVGSSNFDFVSVAAEEEIVAVVSSPPLVAEFLRSLDAMLCDEAGVPRGAKSAWTSSLVLRIAERFALAARHARRTAIDWPRR